MYSLTSLRLNTTTTFHWWNRKSLNCHNIVIIRVATCRSWLLVPRVGPLCHPGSILILTPQRSVFTDLICRFQTQIDILNDVLFVSTITLIRWRILRSRRQRSRRPFKIIQLRCVSSVLVLCRKIRDSVFEVLWRA